MAGTNSRTAAPAKKPAAGTAPAGHVNRIAGVQAAQQSAAEAAAQTTDDDDLAQRAANLIRKREKSRQIKLHARSPEEFQVARKKEAVALTTTDDTPDMRFVENKMLFQADPSLRTDGKTKDNRFLENRPDLLRIAASRPNGKAGVVFADDDEGEGQE